MSTSHVISSPTSDRRTRRPHPPLHAEWSAFITGSARLSYIYCLITGLAFWSPYMYWLAAMVGGGPTARFWHPWFGLAFTLSMFWMYKMWRGDMATTDADRRW